jgi:hypothetical protein
MLFQKANTFVVIWSKWKETVTLQSQSVSILADLLTKRGVFATFGGFFGQ